MRRLIRCLVAAAVAAAGPITATSAQSAPTEERRTLRVDGVERGYLVFLPPAYRPGYPIPLVLVFHGGGGRASGIAPHTGFSRLAEREGFVVVYPDGLGRRWNDGRGVAATHDDVGFVRALLDTLAHTSARPAPDLRHRHLQRRHVLLPPRLRSPRRVRRRGARRRRDARGSRARRARHAEPVSRARVSGHRRSAHALRRRRRGAGGAAGCSRPSGASGFWATAAGCAGTPATAPEPDSRRPTELACASPRMPAAGTGGASSSTPSKAAGTPGPAGRRSAARSAG